MKKQTSRRFFKKSKPALTVDIEKVKKKLKKKELPRINRTITEVPKRPSRLLPRLPSTSFKVSHREVIASVILRIKLSKNDLLKIFISSLILSLFIAIALVSHDVYKTLQTKQNLEKEREKISFEIKYWKGIVGKYKDYRDGYFKLAVLNYQLGEREQSKNYLEKALEIDPNYKEARKLETILTNK